VHLHEFGGLQNFQERTWNMAVGWQPQRWQTWATVLPCLSFCQCTDEIARRKFMLEVMCIQDRVSISSSLITHIHCGVPRHCTTGSTTHAEQML